MKTLERGKKITPEGDPYLYYIAGDETCATSAGYSDSDEAVDEFAEEYPERAGATYAMGVKDDPPGQRNGDIVWEAGDPPDEVADLEAQEELDRRRGLYGPEYKGEIF